MPVRQRRIGAGTAPRRQARITDAGVSREAPQVSPHVLAKGGIALARARQRVEHGRGGDRPLQEWLIGENENALDLALDLGRDVDGQIRADSARFRCRREHRQHQQKDTRTTVSAPATIGPRGQHDIVKAHGTRFVAVRLWHAASVRRHRDGEMVAPRCALSRSCDDTRPALRPRCVSGHEAAWDAASMSSATSIASRARASSVCSIVTKRGSRNKAALSASVAL